MTKDSVAADRRLRIPRAPFANIMTVRGLFEAHLTAADLDRSVAFYRDVVGLQLAHASAARNVAFFWIGARGASMLGVWAAGPGPQTITTHLAFRASLKDVIAAAKTLRSAGVTPLDFDGRPTEEPVVLAWMPAASVYFRDPDGHLLEYLAMLADEPRPEGGIVPWHQWQRTTGRLSEDVNEDE